MRVVVPFGAADPKTRLAPVLDADERRALAVAMLGDVLEAVAATGRHPTVVADTGLADATPDDFDCPAPVTVDERPLTAAVNARLPGAGEEGDSADDEAVAVVMADLALATRAALDSLFAADADVVFAPGRGGGTNALVVRHPAFRVDYHGASIRDHRAIAADVGAETATVDSFRLATDIDEPADLVEVLLHTDGRTAAWLRDAGFSVVADDGRTTVTR
jgi:2-phospho-L-lactate guanylyltransferase